MSQDYILVLYHSQNGHVKKMAQFIGLGIDSSQTPIAAKLKAVPAIGNKKKQTNSSDIATLDDLKNCQGLVVGSPCYFGNMAAEMKHFFDQTTPLWLGNNLVNKPAAVYTSTGSLHGGHESTLLTMMIPLIHHGMLIVGLPYTNSELITTTSGGTPYGPSHLAGPTNSKALDTDEKELCTALGKRMADICHRLSSD